MEHVARENAKNRIIEIAKVRFSFIIKQKEEEQLNNYAKKYFINDFEKHPEINIKNVIDDFIKYY